MTKIETAADINIVTLVIQRKHADSTNITRLPKAKVVITTKATKEMNENFVTTVNMFAKITTIT
jgi:hypothetical protein